MFMLVTLIQSTWSDTFFVVYNFEMVARFLEILVCAINACLLLELLFSFCLVIPREGYFFEDFG